MRAPAPSPGSRRPPAIRCARATMSDRAGSRVRRPTPRSRPKRRAASRRDRGRRGRRRWRRISPPLAGGVGAGAELPWLDAPGPPRREGRSCAHRFASFRPPSARGPRSVRQRRNRVSRSASLPPSPRSPSSTATSAAVSRQPRFAGPHQHMRQPRRQRQAGDRAAVRGRAAIRVDRLERREPARAPPATAASGGGSSQAQRARIGDAP